MDLISQLWQNHFLVYEDFLWINTWVRNRFTISIFQEETNLVGTAECHTHLNVCATDDTKPQSDTETSDRVENSFVERDDEN